MSWQSAWRMSRASSSPRRVGLIPTTVAPANAAPPRRKRYSGTFSRRTPTWNGPSRRKDRKHLGTVRALRHDLAPGPGRVLEAQAGVVVLGTSQDKVGHRRHRPDDSLMTPMGISEPRDLEALREGLTRWVRSWRPDASAVSIAPLAQPATGLSSETFFVELDWTLDRLRARPASTPRGFFGSPQR